ncbi:MAG: hypothetical protein H6607_08515 [Flavobacteriales bacterium]|nr:hypothetical protein [Flavobacteriales bacterium]
MEERKDIFDDLLKSQLEGLMGDVSFDESWSAISEKLDLVDGKKRRIAPFWIWAAAGLALLVGGYGVFKSMNHGKTHETNQNVIAEKSTNKKIKINKNTLPTEVPADDQANESNQPEKRNAKFKRVDELENQSTADGSTPYRFAYQTINLQPRQYFLINKNIVPFGKVALNYLPTINKTVDSESESSPRKGWRRPDFSTNTSPWEFELTASPSLVGKLVNLNTVNSWLINRDYKSVLNMEGKSFGYQVEAEANYMLKKGFYLSSGVGLNQITESINYNYINKTFVQVDMTTEKLSYNERPPNAFDTISYNGINSYKFIEVPLRMGFVLLNDNKELSLRAETGLKYMYLTNMSGFKADETYLSLENLQSQFDKYNRHGVGFTSSIGIYKQLKSGFELGAIPYYNINLSSLRRNDAAIKVKPYNYGFNVSLHYKLSSK